MTVIGFSHLLREPFDLCLSLYYYEKRKGHISQDMTLLERINLYDNWLAGRFNCNIDNYKEILARYSFIGTMENYQSDLNELAELVHKSKVSIPRLNATSRDKQLESVPDEIISAFKNRNRLDYLIYNFVKSNNYRT